MKNLLLIFGIALSTLFNPDVTENKCDLPKDYKEPLPDKKMQSFLKTLMQQLRI